MRLFLLFYLLFSILTAEKLTTQKQSKKPCHSLSKYQYHCNRPAIDPETQQPDTCQPDNSILVSCRVIPGIVCEGLLNDTQLFTLRVPDSCFYNAHTSFSTALILSIFLGFLGIDRLYLGYYAIGLFKMFTIGGLFIMWLTDVVLIGLQILLPADGTNYLMPYYGPRVSPLRFVPNNSNYSSYTCWSSTDCSQPSI